VTSILLSYELHQVLHLQNATHRHLQATSRHSVERADHEYRLLFCIAATGVQL
jgi:hypothetical protein